MLDEFDFWIIYPLFVIASLLLIRDISSLRRYIWGVMLGSAVSGRLRIGEWSR